MNLPSHPPINAASADAVIGCGGDSNSPAPARPVAGIILIAVVIDAMALAFCLFWML